MLCRIDWQLFTDVSKNGSVSLSTPRRAAASPWTRHHASPKRW